MNKKKLVVMMLVLVLVLSLSITALVGCKKDKDDINGYNQTSAIKLEEALGSALWNAAEENNLNSLKASAQLTLTANESVYAIKMNANLALKADSTESNSFGLSFVDVSANNANILNVYYNEGYSKTYGVDYAAYDKMLFVDLGSGANAKHYSINALSVSDTLKDQGVDITDTYLEDHNADSTKIVSGIESILQYFDLVKGMADKFDKKGNVSSSSLYQSEDGQTLLLRLRLDRILSNASEMLGAIDGYTGDLGLALNSSNIGNVLPNVTIDLKFKMSGVEGGDFEKAKLEGFEASLEVPQKDMRIQKSNGGDFVRINIDKTLKLGIGIDFKFGADAQNYNINPLGFTAAGGYTKTNAINVAVKGELTLNEPIELTLNLNGEKKIGIPAGTYGIKLAIDADPVKLIGKSFNFTGIDNIMSTVEGILDAVNYLNIEIKKVNATTEDPGLVIILDRVGDTLKANLKDVSLLGNLLGGLKGEVDLNQILNTVKGLFVKEDDTSATTTADEAADAKTKEMLAEIAKLIASMNINVNCDGNIIDVHVKDHVVNPNDSDPNNDKPDTTIDVDGVVNKTDGLKLDIALKNMLIDDEACGNLEASLVVKDGVITITAKAKDLKLDKGKIALPIDLVLKITGVSYGNAKTAFTA